MKNLKIVILAGGFWTRLWPLSRKTSPKQFCKLRELWWKSLFQLALERALFLTKEENIFVVAAKEILFHSDIQSKELWINLKKENFIIQPDMKETLPIIALATKKIWKENILIMPSDHIIDDNSKFRDSVFLWEKLVKNSIVLFWVKPIKEETAYWYIEKKDNKNISQVKNFYEKPDIQKAKKYIEKWFLWNSGIFLYDSSFFWSELEKVDKKLKDLILSDKSDDDIFKEVEPISIDVWLSEKSKNISCIDLNLYWNDLWSFDSIWEYIKEKDIKNETVIIEGKSKNNIVLNEDRNKDIVLIDVDDLLVIDHEDVLLISKKWSSQKVKKVIKKSKNLIWQTEYRPWWKFRILEEWKWYKTKNITVFPWKKLSLQMHYHRSEHWVVVSWSAKATIWEEEKILEKWESIFVPIWKKHRLENPWKLPLVIIESQIWDYLEEDDIVRFEDDFGRG